MAKAKPIKRREEDRILNIGYDSRYCLKFILFENENSDYRLSKAYLAFNLESTMLRRPPTSIELKMDDIIEYEQMRKQPEKDQRHLKSFDSIPIPSWQVGPKSRAEIHTRIGYVPEKPTPTRSNLM